MKPILLKILAIIDSFTEYTGKLISMLTFFMMLIMVATVLARYLLGTGSVAMQETVLYLHAGIFMLGCAYTLKHDDHVRVDIFYSQYSEKKKFALNLAGCLFFLLPVTAFIALQSYDYVQASWQRKETSNDPGGLPYIYLLKSLLLVMPGLLFFQGLAELVRCILGLLGIQVPHERRSPQGGLL